VSFAAMKASIRADHDAMRGARDRYPTSGTSMKKRPMLGDAVQKIGFQMLIAVRVMTFVRLLGIPFAAQAVSRLIRHLFGAEIHWDAVIADGVWIVHGNGLVISHGATIGPGCILFHNVTLGESIDPQTRIVGAPTIEANVHIGPGAVLLGPITIGEGSKIMANSVVTESVPARSIVRSPTAVVEGRP
jgi:serine acetyltransferase